MSARLDPSGTAARAVVIFAGDPRREARSKGLPPRLLSALHSRIASSAGSLPAIDLFFAFDAAGGIRLDSSGTSCELACGSALDRKVSAVLQILSARYDAVVLLAGDLPGVDPDVLEAALHSLESSDPAAAIGPSGDGGFYLAGFNRAPSFDWAALPWHGERLALELARALGAAGFELTILPRCDDIDSAGDAIRLARAAAGPIRSLILGIMLRSPALPEPHGSPSRPFTASLHVRAPPSPAPL
ncbi:MAG TPA: DUF2064 domain-containing protein [Thermoanaerobaculia bacterium]|nr:DUF2064 domain-containing protein [Thermoanaerobaculia bacterium]